MLQVKWFIAVFLFGLFAVGCSSKLSWDKISTPATDSDWQTIATIKESDLHFLGVHGNDSLSLFVKRGLVSKVKFDSSNAKTVAVINAYEGVDEISVHFDRGLDDPHVDIINDQGQLLNSWCLKGRCFPKAVELAIGGVFVRRENDQVVID